MRSQSTAKDADASDKQAQAQWHFTKKARRGQILVTMETYDSDIFVFLLPYILIPYIW